MEGRSECKLGEAVRQGGGHVSRYHYLKCFRNTSEGLAKVVVTVSGSCMLPQHACKQAPEALRSYSKRVEDALTQSWGVSGRAAHCILSKLLCCCTSSSSLIYVLCLGLPVLQATGPTYCCRVHQRCHGTVNYCRCSGHSSGPTRSPTAAHVPNHASRASPPRWPQSPQHSATCLTPCP